MSVRYNIKNFVFNFISFHAVNSIDENIIGFTIEYVLTLSHFDLLSSIYDISISKVNGTRRNDHPGLAEMVR